MKLLLKEGEIIREIKVKEEFLPGLWIQFEEFFYLKDNQLPENQWLYFLFQNKKYGLWLSREKSYRYLKEKPKDSTARKGSFGYLVSSQEEGEEVKLNFGSLVPQYQRLLEKPIRKKEDNPSLPFRKPSLWIQLGPSLTMSMATLANASFQALRLYEKGESNQEIAMVFLMPGLLFFSLCFWQPLNHFLEKKQTKKEFELKQEIARKQEKTYQQDVKVYQESLEPYAWNSQIQLRHPTAFLYGLGRDEQNNWVIKALSNMVLMEAEEVDFIHWIRYWNRLYHVQDLKGYLLIDSKRLKQYPELLHLELFYHEGKRHIYGSCKELSKNFCDSKAILFSFLPIKGIYSGFVLGKGDRCYPFREKIWFHDESISYESESETLILKRGRFDLQRLAIDFYQAPIPKGPSTSFGSLCAKVGRTFDKELYLDLSEQGHGPHAMIIGTTGSGKTEFLLHWLFQLASRYDSAHLQFLLFDFKGDSLKQSLSGIPHVNASISNLEEGDLDRALCALELECAYRERLFQESSRLSKSPIQSYQDYVNGAFQSETLSQLIVVFDEFAQFKQNFPDKLGTFISLARIGRSLGIHFIVIAQKATGIINEQILANIRLRICMKVMDKQDCLEVIKQDKRDQLKQAGDFVALVEEEYISGRGYYLKEPAFQRIYRLDAQLHRLPIYQEKKELRQTYLERIRKQELHPIRRIWLKKPEASQLNAQVVGIIDDYYHRDHVELKIDSSILVLYEKEEDRDCLEKRCPGLNYQRIDSSRLSLRNRDCFLIYLAPFHKERVSILFGGFCAFQELEKGEGLCLWKSKICSIRLF